jgi:hypothetical protein
MHVCAARCAARLTEPGAQVFVQSFAVLFFLLFSPASWALDKSLQVVKPNTVRRDESCISIEANLFWMCK